MNQAPQIIELQTGTGAPEQEFLERGTGLTQAAVAPAQRLRHMPEDVYSLAPESHILRLAGALMGDAGLGGIRKALALSRQQRNLRGARFFDLDRFYGAIFNIGRTPNEVLGFNPYSETGTSDDWLEVGMSDSSYRTRIEQFARAINWGATPNGVELAAEAILSVDCDIIESYVVADRTLQTYADLEAIGTYGDLESFTYRQLEGASVVGAGNSTNRSLFTVIPKRLIDDGERHQLMKALDRLRPVDALMSVDPEGLATHRPMTPRAITASSEYWEVHQLVHTESLNLPAGVESPYQVTSVDGSPSEQPRPPFAGYQGEAWTCNGDISSIAYKVESPNGALPGPPIIYRLGDGSRNVYRPELALASLSSLLSGRAASDGVSVIAPYFGQRLSAQRDRGGYGGFDDGFSINEFRTGMYIDRIGASHIGRVRPWVDPGFIHQPTEMQFWMTAERLSTDDTEELLEITFVKEVSMNYLSLLVSKLPHRLTIEALVKGAWTTVFVNTISTSWPQKLGNNTDPHQHPYHTNNASHWVKVSGKLQVAGSVRATAIRMRINRNTSIGSPPLDHFGKPYPYSIAIRLLEFGFRITQWDDVVRPEILTSRWHLGQSYNLLGSTVDYQVGVRRAKDLVLGTGTWRSEPQPSANAVVNLYVDVSTADGLPQVVDRFYIEPLTTGVLCHLYWSSDDPAGIPFEATDDSLPFGVAIPTGPLVASSEGIAFPSADLASITIDNSAVSLDFTKAWWAGIELDPNFSFSDSGPFVVFDFAGNRLEFVSGYLRFTNEHAESIEVPTFFAVGNTLRFALAYLPTATDELAAGYHLVYRIVANEGRGNTLTHRPVDSVLSDDPTEVGWASAHLLSAVHLAAPTAPTAQPTGSLRFGGRITNPQYTGNFLLRNVVVKSEEIRIDSFYKFSGNAEKFTVKPEYRPSVATAFTNNALLRFNAKFIADEFPSGFVGGTGDTYEELTWHPISRDFELQKGYMTFRPTRARFWKFEFSNLQVEPYESLIPIHREVVLFPPNVAKQSLQTHSDVALRDEKKTFIDIAGVINRRYVDSNIPVISSLATQASERPLPTEAQWVSDPTMANDLRRRSWAFGFTPMDTVSRKPFFSEVGRHTYTKTRVTHEAKIAFFVGIKKLVPYRVDYTASDDTRVFRDHLHDLSQIAPGSTWSFDPGSLKVPGAPAVATSIPINTHSPIIGVQFATQQSPPLSRIADDQFRDPALARYDWSDDLAWHRIGDVIISYNAQEKMVSISRDVDEKIVILTVTPGLIQTPDHPVFAWKPLAVGAGPDGYVNNYGGIESPNTTVSPSGMIWAAVRFIAETDIKAASPLTLEIVGGDGVTILASKTFTAQKGEVVEDYVGYILGTITSPGGVDSTVKVRLIQYGGPSKDAWKLDALSLYDDAILWEFSVDGGTTYAPAYGIRSNPYGVMKFSTPGNSLKFRVTGHEVGMSINAIQIRPWYQDVLVARRDRSQRWGPNISPFDEEPSIEQDPEFNVWTKPIPSSWFRRSRAFPHLPLFGGDGWEGSVRLGRIASDTITPTDDVVRLVGVGRSGIEQQMGEPGDVATRGVTYAREGIEDYS